MVYTAPFDRASRDAIHDLREAQAAAPRFSTFPADRFAI
jgi:hypothetical protein